MAARLAAARLRGTRTLATIRRHEPGEAVELRPGDAAVERRAFGDEDVRAFARVSGDTNALHLDEEAARASRFGRRVVHGMLTASLFSTVFGTRLPGAIYLGQSVRFRAPVFIGDEIEARVTVREVAADSRVVTCDTVVTNADGVEVVTGEARVLVPELARR